MIEQQRAVVQQALEALNTAYIYDEDNADGYYLKAIEALRRLLEQPVQGPVGEVSGHDWGTGLLYRDLEPGTPLYTTPPAQPATSVDFDEVAAFCRVAFGRGAGDFNAGIDGMLAELKLREKNGGAA